MGLTRFIINFAVKNQKIESFNNFLFIGPHPDDIEIGAGGTVKKLTSLGKKVTFLICTDGRYGKENLDEEISEENLIKIRREECVSSAKYLGVSDVRFLDLCDGNQYSYKDLISGIATIINDVKPEVIFAPDPDVISECHADHINVGKAAKEIANFANYKEIFQQYLPKHISANTDIEVKAICLYFTNKPNTFVGIRKYFKYQLNSIYIHSSQYKKGHPATNSVVLYLKIRSFEFGFFRFKGLAEGFRMMNKTRMHCLPEASK